MRTIEEFCNLHHACSEGREWALANCKDMRQVWETARPAWLIWIATRQGVLTDNELRRFAIVCARSVEHLLTDERSSHAIDMAEKFLDGEASAEELEAAAMAADAAADTATYAALGTSWAAADAAAMSAWAAWDARAAWAAVSAAVSAAADADTNAAAWLRANTNPTF